jgi:SAM-dependent methyltransferase
VEKSLIPFFLVERRTLTRQSSREEKLARQMGAPPWEVGSVDEALFPRELANSVRSPQIGLIFDPELWYSRECWERWSNAVIQEESLQRIDVPLGNQAPSWQKEFGVEPYFTLRGLEHTSLFRGVDRWVIKRSTTPDIFRLAVVPLCLLKDLPEDLTLGDLPEYWAKMGQEIRIFCEGWLHSFNAIKDAGRREDLLSMCEWKGRVLELGCSEGLMAEACKIKGFDGQWIGVDFDPAKIIAARSFSDLVVQADINQPLPFSAGTKFDRIVCGDVLEHLSYPWDLLKDLRCWLKPEGLLVASFPNVGHWSTLEDLLSGRWDEAPSGLFCVTHLRFGTRRSWERWFVQSGWRIMKWEAEKLPLPEKWIFSVNAVDRLFDHESLETVRYRVMAGI